MSRLEKYHNIEKEQVLDDAYKVNPINNNEVLLKRERKYQAVKLKKLDVASKVIENSEQQPRELFDIEQAFKALEKEHLDVDNDTRVEIMSELFAYDSENKNHNHKKKLINNAKSLKERFKIKNKDNIYKDESTNKIYISEDELISILAQKEDEHNKKVKRKKSWQNDSVKLSNTMLFDKDDLSDNEVNGIKSNDLVKNRLPNKKIKSVKKESSFDKVTIFLLAIIIVLVIVLGYLVFNFFNGK
jgi:hypothetical protein